MGRGKLEGVLGRAGWAGVACQADTEDEAGWDSVEVDLGQAEQPEEVYQVNQTG